MTALDDSLKKLTAQFENLKDIDKTLVALAGGYRLMRGAQERSPVKTGFLRENQEVVPVGEGAEYRANAQYSFTVEFGSSKWAGKPFVRPTIDEDGKDIVQVMADEVQHQIEQRGGK